VAESGRSCAVEYLGEISNDPVAIGKLCDRLERPSKTLATMQTTSRIRCRMHPLWLGADSEFVRGLSRYPDTPPIFDALGALPESNASHATIRLTCCRKSGTFVKCREWLAPEVLEARRRQLGVPHRVLDILVPEVIL
jgi:hypothetical protein